MIAVIFDIVIGILFYKLVETWVKERLREKREIDKEIAEEPDQPPPRRNFRNIWDFLGFWLEELHGVLYLIVAVIATGLIITMIKAILWATGLREGFL